MVFPPPVLLTNHTDLNPVLDQHPAAHNDLATAANDTTDWINGRLAVRKQSTVNGSVPNNVWTLLTTGQTVEYTHGEDIRSQGSETIASDTGGFFLLFGVVVWAASSGNYRRVLGVSTSSSGSPGPDNQSAVKPHTATQVQRICIPHRVTGAAGSAFYLWGLQDSGATLAITFRELTVLRLTPHF